MKRKNSKNLGGIKINLLPILRRLVRKFEYADLFWSQEGEDVILRSLFFSEGWESGFYVDVGAHHPKRYSNTYYFYRQGWRGINIDANEEAIRMFNVHRPKDVNVWSGVGRTASTMKYYNFQEPAFNTFSEVRYEQIKTQVPLKNVIDVPIHPLSEILRRHMPSENQHINFMNIDVEGMDYEVLLSNDWEIYRPDYLLIEIWEDKEDMDSIKEVMFLKGEGYTLAAMSNRTFIFKKTR